MRRILRTDFMNNMLTLEEVRTFLEIPQEDLEKYIKQGKLHAYKIGGTYIRFRKDEVLNLRSELRPRQIQKLSFFSRVSDFWRFNNFYIICLVIVAVLAYFAIQN